MSLTVVVQAARLRPPKPARDPEHQLIEQHPPAGGVYAVASGHSVITGRQGIAQAFRFRFAPARRS